MIKSVKIENYKSIQELEVDVGRFNVIIGENGAGKSNFLEAMALFGAAEADKLDNEFLSSRGVRSCIPKKMISLFEPVNSDNINITLHPTDNKNQYKHTLQSSNEAYPKLEKRYRTFSDIATLDTPLTLESLEELLEVSRKISLEQDILIKNYSDDKKTKDLIDLKAKQIHENLETVKINLLKMKENKFKTQISNFILYSPENTALRNFYREGQIEPLGINGEGLLKLLKVMQESEAAAFQDVLNCLELFDWFETIEVPKDLSSMEDKVSIKDKYLTTLFDQRSANEGFLFVLFYAALFCSQYTPKIFAIDNIDASFNPKLCTVLIKKLVELAKKYDKQVFVTTHNPAILDGLDLGDEEQKLFVASRNKQGHTRFKTLTLSDKPKSSTGEPIRLSEAFLRGYLGGLPKNF